MPKNFDISLTFPGTVQGRISGTSPVARIGGINENITFHAHSLYTQEIWCVRHIS